MSVLLLTRNAFTHIESQIGDGAEMSVLVSGGFIELSISYRDKVYKDVYATQIMSEMECSSGTLLERFTKDAKLFFAGSN